MAGSPSPGRLQAGQKARLIRGIAYALDNRAPAAVKRVIAAANRIRLKPYIYGGGHTLSRRL